MSIFKQTLIVIYNFISLSSSLFGCDVFAADHKLIDMSHKTTLSGRLSAYVSALAGVVFLLALLIVYFIGREEVVSNATKNAEQVIQIIKSRTEQIVVSVEYDVNELAWHVEQCNTEGQVVELSKHLLSQEPLIRNVVILIAEPADHSDRLTMGEYIFRDGDSLVVERIAAVDQYVEQEWYAKPQKSNQAAWCAHLEISSQTHRAVSYSVPLYDRQGKFMGVCCANIQLDWIVSSIRDLKPYPKSNITITTDNGFELFSPDPDDGVDGSDNEETLEFYKSLSVKGWEVKLSCAETDVFANMARLNLIIALIMFVGLVLLYFVVRWIVRRITSPLSRFSQAAQTIAKGDFEATLPDIKSHDEIFTLSNSMRNMQDSLKDYMAQLQHTTAINERIESELFIAAGIQRAIIIDHLPRVGNFDIHALLSPAREVGGDLYDVVRVGDKIWFIVGDVSGKGVPASLYMSVVVYVFRAMVRQCGSVSQIVSDLNDVIAKGNKTSMFVTALVGVIDTANSEMELCNAGHNPPILKHRAGAHLLKQQTNIAMGVVEDFEFESTKYPFDNNSSLVLYTDGVTESRSVEGEEFGDDALLELVVNSGNLNPKLLIQEIFEAVGGHSLNATQSDDITLLVITRYASSMELSPRIESIGELAPFIEKLSMIETEAGKLRLAVEELVVNAINYSCTTTPLEIAAIERDDSSVIYIEYGGEEFDPLSAPKANTESPIESREVGGLGIFIAKQMTNALYYKRVGQVNVLSVVMLTSKR